MLATALLCGSVFIACAQEETPKPDETLDIKTLKLADEDYAMPVPGEILSTLKSAKPEVWTKVTAAAQSLDISADDEASAAIQLGAAVADCFLSIETKDAALFEKRSNTALEAAKKLGAEQAILDSGKSLQDLVKEEAWMKLVPKLDNLHLETLAAMRKVDDADSEAICLASGWLRGLYLFSEGLLADYSAEPTLALRQKDLVNHLIKKMDGISDSAKESPQVKALSTALSKLPDALPDGKEDTLTKEQVATLNEIAKSAFAK
ncbi:MAG: hypothetical protein QM627_12425 [Luteolibacter sp.]